MPTILLAGFWGDLSKGNIKSIASFIATSRGADDLPARDEGSPIALSLHQSDCHTEKPKVRDMVLHQTVTYFSRETGIGHKKL